MKTSPANFLNPHSVANRAGRALWRLAYLFLFRPTPFFMGWWRTFLLRCFGAKLGFARFAASSKVWAPWLLKCGDNVYIDERVNLYNAYGIELGDRVIISQGSFVCTASHDYSRSDYPLIGEKIKVGNDVWIAADAFIAPGVTVESGAVVGARAVVIRDVAAWSVVAGNPARLIKTRELL